VTPDETILIENPIATVNESNDRDTAQAFIDFLYTEEAQRIFAGKGYRPVVEGALDKGKFPAPARLFEIDRFGGWSKVNDDFFDPEKGVIAQIFKSQGKSTAKE
jgi:sulfate transport system substrate-binding protein